MSETLAIILLIVQIIAALLAVLLGIRRLAHRHADATNDAHPHGVTAPETTRAYRAQHRYRGQ